MTTSPTYLIIVCICCIIAICASLFAKKMHVGLAMIIFPIIGAFALGATPAQVAGFALGGISNMVAQLIQIPLAVCFFYLINEAGLFRVIARFLIKILKNKLWMVLLMTAFIAMFCGTGSAVMLTTTGIMIPILRKMNVRAEAAICLLCSGQMFICMMPWQNAVMTIAAVTGMQATDIFHKMGPIIIAGIIITFILALVLALVEKKKGAGLSDEEFNAMKQEILSKPADVKVPKAILVIDAVLVVALIVMLIGGWMNGVLLFLIGTVLVFVLNFPNQTSQTQALQKVAPIAFNIVLTIFGLATMMGIFSNTGMLGAVGKALSSIIPSGLTILIPALIAVVGFWLAFFGGSAVVTSALLPILTVTYTAIGGNGLVLACSGLLAVTPLLMLGPYAVSGYMVAGFAKVDYNSHMKYSLKYIYPIVLITTALMIIFGIIPLSL